MQWFSSEREIDAAGHTLIVREFDVPCGERTVPGVLWCAQGTRPGAPLILFGHGASGTRYQRPIPDLARALVRDESAFCVAIDGPVHGRRQQSKGGREAFWPEWERAGTVDDMVADWRAVLDALQAQADIGTGPVGYWGLSMGTIYGAPLVGAEPRIVAAVLGLMGLSGPAHYRPIVAAAASAIRCPVLFIMQLEDELFAREDCLALFDAIGSEDKRLHANAGLHPAVPLEELRHSREFLSRYLRGDSEPRQVAFGVSE